MRVPLRDGSALEARTRSYAQQWGPFALIVLEGQPGGSARRSEDDCRELALGVISCRRVRQRFEVLFDIKAVSCARRRAGGSNCLQARAINHRAKEIAHAGSEAKVIQAQC